MDHLKLSKKLKKRRVELNLTQEQLAEKLDISAVYVGQLERGERNMTLTLLLKYSETLEVSIEYLLRDLTENNHQSKLQEFSELIKDLDSKELSKLMDIIKIYASK